MRVVSCYPYIVFRFYTIVSVADILPVSSVTALLGHLS